MASKYPQMNTIKFMVHESLEFGGFCTRPSLAVWHGIARLIRGVFCEKLKIHCFWDVKV